MAKAMRGKNMRCAAERHSIWLCSSSHLPSLAYRPNRETYDSCRESYDSFRKSYSSNHEPWLGKFTVHKKSGRVPSSHHSPTRFPTLSRRTGQERTAKHRRRTTRRLAVLLRPSTAEGGTSVGCFSDSMRWKKVVFAKDGGERFVGFGLYPYFCPAYNFYV